MKSLFPNFFLLFTAVMLLSFAQPVYQSGFSGTWVLNAGKSNLGKFSWGGVPLKITINQKASYDMVITTTLAGLRGENPIVVTESLTEEGESEGTMVLGNIKKKSSLAWEDKNERFSVHYTLLVEESGIGPKEVYGSEFWRLGKDGKTLIVSNRVWRDKSGIRTDGNLGTAVFDRQNDR